MEVPLEITFREVEKSDDSERLIREKAAKLEKICDSLISCRVAVESPHAHQQSGSPFRVRINLRVPPGHDLVVRRESSEGYLHERLPVVISEAFDAAFRQLKKLMEKQQGQVKVHPEQERIAFVAQLFPEEGYGFIQTREGRELYFHRNSVLNDDFDRLEIGTGVRYVAGAGVEGPKATTVQIVDKPGASADESVI
jgi:cold shock CspA family protein/ribosome-associated translation inhibitor RaiA